MLKTIYNWVFPKRKPVVVDVTQIGDHYRQYALAVSEFLPQKLDLKVANLEIRSPGPLGFGTSVVLDGKPVAAKSINIDIGMDGPIIVTMNWIPGLEVKDVKRDGVVLLEEEE
jgi:hypothetical protein